ncbi:hypothetical protein BV25DRAFT_1532763 [Artomyces pyxidatus]|uniref:Uncharacterized protein n=1 Tax=Artomyces pyxidatus TaxID=48021 RepID=A0ACB8SLP4_9AGAM|nr:hypothetical protein BV25DRAFT_1532763 [Artomyces pyxidatus]
MTPPQDADTHRTRARSNTNTFPSSFWVRRRTEPVAALSPLPPVPSQQLLPLETLIANLTPPAVPSLSTARALALALASPASPGTAVTLAALQPVLSALCAVDAPPALRATGFEILAAYLDAPHTHPLSLSDRLALFSFFPSSGPLAWVSDVWEPRFRALSALTQDGAEIVGIEVPLLTVLESWIDGAFVGILTRDNVSPTDRAERERSIDMLCAFLMATCARRETMARLSDEDVADVLRFYGRLIERALLVPNDQFASPASVSEQQSPAHTPTRATHRRHHSSASIPLASPVNSTAPSVPTRHVVDVAVTAYLNHLSSQLQYLAPIHLNLILPILFRTLAFHASALPRLSLSSSDQFETSFPLERRVVETLDKLLNGAYTTYCFIILKQQLMPQMGHGVDIRTSIQTSTGACRALRIYIRRALCTRLARAYIARMSSDTHTLSGAPGHIDLGNDLFERAWAKDEITRGDLGKVGRILRRSADAWVALTAESFEGVDINEREKVLLEVAGVLKDVFQEYDERAENEDNDEEESNVVGEILLSLTSYICPLKNADGTPYLVPLTHPADEPSLFLRAMAALLSRDHATTPSNPLLSTILLSISDHLVDADTAKLITIMVERGDLSPITLDWHSNWTAILGKPTIANISRPLTRTTLLDALQEVFAFVRDVPAHRHLLVDLVLDFCRKQDTGKGGRDGYEVIWNILADELVLRQTEAQEHSSEQGTLQGDAFIGSVLDLLMTTAMEDQDVDHDIVSESTLPSTLTSSNVSPILSRGQSEFLVPQKEKESSMPGFTSLLSSFTSGASTRSHSQAPPRSDDTSSTNIPLSLPEPVIMPAAVGAVAALVHIFSQLAFTPHSLNEQNRMLAVRVFHILVGILPSAKSPRARLSVLQFFFRLRVDRDHRLYSVYERYDRLGNIAALAGLIGRVEILTAPGATTDAAGVPEDHEVHDAFKARARPPERDGRKASRGRDARPSRSGSSRSRSRATTRVISATLPRPESKHRKPIWHVPESLPFTIPESDTPSDGLISYDPLGPGNRSVLPISSLLLALIDAIQEEKDWEILSYILCHLPTLLSNKHFFCGPKSRAAISKLNTALCNGINTGELGSSITHWPAGLRPRDAHGLAFHTLSVLISYRSCFELSHRHILVGVLITGLSGQQSTIKACLQSLSLAAFELPDSMKRFLPDILTKLSQIMTNASMAVHIIDFLAIIGSLPSLYANFIEADYKMVFGVALQYLRLHNRPEASSETSWALSQHLRIMSYYIVYLWFLAVKLPDRPRHVTYITRQLLLANEDREEVDEPAEVCFDWLARYTYASADPRPTNSMLSDIVMNAQPQHDSEVISQKTWVVGNSLVTIRSLAKIGWVDVVARRASGLTRIVARIENVPMVGPGEVDPDTLSVPAILAMDHSSVSSEEENLYQVRRPFCYPYQGVYHVLPQDVLRTLHPDPIENSDSPPRPDPITGYVWRGSAPSQRRKEVAIDPSFFALQLSAYPGTHDGRRRRFRVHDTEDLDKVFKNIDRIPVIDTHKVGIMYVAPGQTLEQDILGNVHGSPAYTRFLEGLGRLINLRGQVDVYAGGLDPDEDGEYAYAWWDDIGQILYHTATLMPSHLHDPHHNGKKKHIGNDYVRIVWNDSGVPYKFDTLSTQFQFVNIVIEPHSLGAIAAFSNNLHENEYFRVTLQRAPGMSEFSPIGHFKLISAESLPLLVRQLSLLADWFANIFWRTGRDTEREEMPTNWQYRLQAIKRFRAKMAPAEPEPVEGILQQESRKDFTIDF